MLTQNIKRLIIEKIFVWCSDVDKFTGEGILANKFINDLKKYNPKLKIVVKNIPQKKIILLRKFWKHY